MVDRKTETKESLRERLDTAKIEMDWSREEGSVDFLIVNDDLDKAYLELVKAVRL